MTPSEGLQHDTAEHRLHPASLMFSVGTAARNLLLPALFVMLAARGSVVQYWVALFFLPSVALALVRYFSYRYRFEPEDLVIREGIVTRNERHVPYARIQNIDLVQNVLHRVLGVAEVRVETAGGEKPEAVMRVLSLEAVDRMRSQVFAERGAPAAAGAEPAAAGTDADAPRMLHRLGWRDVLLFGVISNKGLVVVAAATGVLWQLDLDDKLYRWLTPENISKLEELQRPRSLGSALVLGAIGVLAFVLLMRVLSIVWAFLKFHGFRLQGRGDDLRAEHGLLTRVSKTIPRHRIQVLSAREGFLHRLCGRCSVQVRTAGAVAQEQGRGRDRLWLAPLIRKDELPALLREVLPALELDDPPWRPIAARAWLRLLRRALALLAPVVAVGLWYFGAWVLAAVLPLAALALVNARLYARHAGYAVVPGAVLYRSGWWVRQWSVVRFSKIQSVERRESPFDRRNAMASLKVDTAGGSRGHGIDIAFLDAPAATSLLGRLSAEAGRTSFRW